VQHARQQRFDVLPVVAYLQFVTPLGVELRLHALQRGFGVQLAVAYLQCGVRLLPPPLVVQPVYDGSLLGEDDLQCDVPQPPFVVTLQPAWKQQKPPFVGTLQPARQQHSDVLLVVAVLPFVRLLGVELLLQLDQPFYDGIPLDEVGLQCGVPLPLCFYSSRKLNMFFFYFAVVLIYRVHYDIYGKC
jgi:hypothetical protein